MTFHLTFARSFNSCLTLLAPAALICLAASALAVPAEAAGGTERKPAPQVAAASNDGEQAIGKMKVPRDLKVTLFASEPMLANPVAICADEKGRFYVVETYRFQHDVFDIRGHMDWYEDDLSGKTIEERMAWTKRKLGPNYRRMTATNSDRVVRLEDAADTGKADKSTVFADGFDDPADGVAASVLARKGNVYFADIPNLWLLQDTKGEGKADVRKSLSYGYGIRYAYLGHDLHGLRFGPDGRLYFSIGDRAANVTKTVDGRTVVNTESGSIFRCNPDGSGLEIFATGVRNPQQLIFDDFGNLFTGDNNPDFGDPARWVYLIEGGDSGWRIGYQHAPHPRNGGPWMAESLWQTADKLDAESQIPAVAHLGAGPSGVAYYPGTGLNNHYQQHFFMCDFRGGSTGSGVHTFVLKPKGAGWTLNDHEEFVWNCLATDICFGPAGGAYVTDWVQGWDTTGKGRVYRIFDPQTVKSPGVLEVKKLLADGFEKKSVDELVTLLSHPDQRVRQEAQFELADRGTPSIAPLAGAAAKAGELHPRLHAIWALGQISRKDPKALDPLVPLLADPDAEVRAQSAKLLGEGHVTGAYAGIVKLLADPSSRDRMFAAFALGKLGARDAVGPVIQMLRENQDQDAWLRHAGVMALVWLADTSAIETAAKDESPGVRMAALLALRRLGSPAVGGFVSDADPKVVREAARAINDTFNEPARPSLAALIASDSLSDPVIIRTLNANYRLGTAQSAEALARFAARSTAPERWRVEALHLLGEWEHPSARDYVMNLWRPLADRDVKVAQQAVAPVLASIIRDAPESVKVAATALIDKLKIQDATVAVEIVSNTRLSPKLRVTALQVLAARDDPKLAGAVTLCLKDRNPAVRIEAIRCLAKLPSASTQLDSLLAHASVPEAQAAYAALGQLAGHESDETLGKAMDALLAGKLAPDLRLDVLEAAAHRSDPAVAAKVKQYEESLPKNDLLAPFRVSLTGGDAEAGLRIFRERVDVSCVRCHTVRGEGGIVGPKLDGIGSRQTREYLLESIIYPNAKIAVGFESAVVKTKAGKTFLGVVRKDDADALVLIDNDGKEIRIAKSDIASREHGLSPMPEGLAKLLSKRDLRDLVQFLATTR